MLRVVDQYSKTVFLATTYELKTPLTATCMQCLRALLPFGRLCHLRS